MAVSLNVIALISGGKDSLFSILHCLANDHNVVVLANLFPPSRIPKEPTSDVEQNHDVDLNSYMYQTAGHDLLPLYSEALSIPLYRASITGSAVNTERDYSKVHRPGRSKDEEEAEEEDETESLIPLLKNILVEHPSANALSTGAILSTYQRTRIENIAIRLNLVPLSYLWQYPFLPVPLPTPGGLLDDMKAVRMKAHIVKVASGGLDEAMLWQDVLCEEGRRRVERAMAKFGGSVLGEGGEYETLVLDGPAGVWKRTISVEEGERKTCRGEGGEAWVVITGGRTVEKAEDTDKNDWRQRLRIPKLFDARFEKILGQTQLSENKIVAHQDITRQVVWTPQLRLSYSKFTYTISNVIDSGDRIEDQMMNIIDKLAALIRFTNSNMDDIIFTTILLRHMSDFSIVNGIYKTQFTKPNPPARVTVAVGDALPNRALIMLSIIVRNPTPSRPHHDLRGLHVQSRSYWAPANIGPYSQAISMTVAEESNTLVVFVAGQIPLVPSSMEVLDVKGKIQSTNSLDNFRKQAVLSIQHLWRIGLEMKVTWWSGAIAFIATQENTQSKAIAAWEIWESLHVPAYTEDNGEEEEEGGDGPDVWDRKYGNHSSYSTEETSPRHLPDFEALRPGLERSSAIPGFFAVQVDEIPRGCEIEWQSIGITSHEVSVHSLDTAGSKITACRALDSSIEFMYISLAHTANPSGLHKQAKEAIAFKDVLSHVGAKWFSIHATVYTPRPGVFCNKDVQMIIPCRGIWGPGGERLDAGLVLRLEHGIDRP